MHKTVTIHTTPAFCGKEPSFWQLGRDGITSSLADLYLNDPYQAYWKYVRGLSGPDTSLPLEFGMCCHKIREWAYTNTGVPDAVALVDRYQKFWEKTYRKPTLAQKERQEMVYGLAEIVMANYFRRWDGDLSGKYAFGNKGSVSPKTWVSHEEKFDVPYTYADGLTVRIRGRRDGVFLDEKGQAWVLDTKCLGRIADQDISDTLPINFQQMLYVTAYLLETGTYPRGVVLDVVKRPQERQGKASLPDFLVRVKEKWDDVENYQENYGRFRMVLSKKEIDNWRATRLDKFMVEIRMWWEGSFDPCPRDNHAIGKYGRCEMFNAVARGETIGYTKRNSVFPELED